MIRQRQVAAANRVIAALPAVLDAVDRSVSQARVDLTAAEAERTQQNEELSALRREESSLRERLSAVSESVHGLEMQVYEKKLHLSTLLERAGEELGLIEDVLVAEYGPQVPVPDLTEGSSSSAASASRIEAPEKSGETDQGFDTPPAGATRPPVPGKPFVRAEQQQRLAQAERKLAQLGRVNPLALEEFAALEQRHKFLTEQLADLTQHPQGPAHDHRRARRADAGHLRERVRGHQARVRPGVPGAVPRRDRQHLPHRPRRTCSRRASRSRCKPAGKKIERLSLLSGGERSLAAVALLIAIFKARPSPFYIMDEVEAALDDANLGRLLTIFEDLRAELASSSSSPTRSARWRSRTPSTASRCAPDGVSAVVGQRVAEHTSEPDA